MEEKKWNHWLNNSEGSMQNEIKHCLKPVLEGEFKCEMHCFSDGSDVSYGSIIYFKVVSKEVNEACCDILAAKYRVSPIKKVTCLG